MADIEPENTITTDNTVSVYQETDETTTPTSSNKEELHTYTKRLSEILRKEIIKRNPEFDNEQGIQMLKNMPSLQYGELYVSHMKQIDYMFELSKKPPTANSITTMDRYIKDIYKKLITNKDIMVLKDGLINQNNCIMKSALAKTRTIIKANRPKPKRHCSDFPSQLKPRQPSYTSFVRIGFSSDEELTMKKRKDDINIIKDEYFSEQIVFDTNPSSYYTPVLDNSGTAVKLAEVTCDVLKDIVGGKVTSVSNLLTTVAKQCNDTFPLTTSNNEIGLLHFDDIEVIVPFMKTPETNSMLNTVSEWSNNAGINITIETLDIKLPSSFT